MENPLNVFKAEEQIYKKKNSFIRINVKKVFTDKKCKIYKQTQK